MHVNRRFLFGLALFALAMLTFGAVARVEAQMSPCVFCTDCGRQGKIGNHAWDAGSSLQVNSRGRVRTETGASTPATVRSSTPYRAVGA